MHLKRIGGKITLLFTALILTSLALFVPKAKSQVQQPMGIEIIASNPTQLAGAVDSPGSSYDIVVSWGETRKHGWNTLWDDLWDWSGSVSDIKYRPVGKPTLVRSGETKSLGFGSDLGANYLVEIPHMNSAGKGKDPHVQIEIHAWSDEQHTNDLATYRINNLGPHGNHYAGCEWNYIMTKQSPRVALRKPWAHDDFESGHQRDRAFQVLVVPPGKDDFNYAKIVDNSNIVHQLSELVTPNSPVHGDQLHANQGLLVDQSIQSGNGNHRLTMQSDGNLVLYSSGKAVWSTKTTGEIPQCAVMQDDGNFVFYDKSMRAKWASNTRSDANRNSHLIIQNDGNLVIYNPAGNVVWASNANGQ